MINAPTPPAGNGTSTAVSARDDEYQRESRKGFAVLALFGGTFVCLAAMVMLQSRAPDISLDRETLGIRSGPYGVHIRLAEIDEIQLVHRLTGLGSRKNAFQFGSAYAGRFAMKPYGDALLFINTNTPPFILIRTHGDVTLFNTRDSTSTHAMFDSLARLTKRP